MACMQAHREAGSRYRLTDLGLEFGGEIVENRGEARRHALICPNQTLAESRESGSLTSDRIKQRATQCSARVLNQSPRMSIREIYLTACAVPAFRIHSGCSSTSAICFSQHNHSAFISYNGLTT